MSEQYDLYLQEHKENVAKAFHWLRLKLPHLLVGMPNIKTLNFIQILRK